jgi:hypothetical protein
VGCWLDRYELKDRASEVLSFRITDRLRIKTLSGVALPEPFSAVDELAADIVACIRFRGDQFESDDQLEEWLTADGITYPPERLSEALSQLIVCGLLIRPDPEGWGAPHPGYLSTPSVLVRY